MSESYGPYCAHPIADKFDMLEESALAGLADSIKREGQAIPCVVWGNYLVDGRNRWRACESAGVAPKIEHRQFANDAECGRWIIAVNKDRRHLTISQLAWICTEPDVLTLYREEAKDRHRENGGDKKSSDAKSAPANLREPIEDRHSREAVAQAAAAFGVSARSAQSAQAVRARGTDELALAVREKRMAVSVAAEVAKLPAEKQRPVTVCEAIDCYRNAASIREAA